MTREERDARIWLGEPFRPDSKRAEPGTPERGMFARNIVKKREERKDG